MTLPTKVLTGAAASLALAVFVLAGFLQHYVRTAAEAGRAAEAARVEAEGVKVARQASERQLNAQLADAKTQVTGFAAALARAERAASTHAVAVARGSTGAVAVSASSAPASPGGAPASPSCVLHEGDQGAIDVATAQLDTKAGNRLLVQAADASRVNPDGSKTKLFGGELRADLTQYLSKDVEPPKNPGIGAGALVLCTGPKCSYGGIVAAPPVFGGRVEAAAGAFAGGSGTGLQAQVIVRLP